MARRWVCPSCGDGLNGPERPRKNDVRRYCRACSWETGYLVERVAPALERQRAAAKTATRERQQVKAAKERQRRIVDTTDTAGNAHAIDVHKELHRALKSMGFFKRWATAPTMDDITVTIHRRNEPHTSGRAWGNFQVVFTFGTAYEEALEVIYHEAAHLASPVAEHHGPRFRRILADALQARWPFVRYGSTRRGRCYGADHDVVTQLKDHVRAGGEL